MAESLPEKENCLKKSTLNFWQASSINCYSIESFTSLAYLSLKFLSSGFTYEWIDFSTFKNETSRLSKSKLGAD